MVFTLVKEINEESKSGNPIPIVPTIPVVTVDFCNERFHRILDKMTTIDEKIDGVLKKSRQHGIERRVFLYSLLGSIISGLTVGVILFLLK